MTIRELRRGDVAAVTDLASQLGYPSTEEQVAKRIMTLIGKTDEAVLVAESGEGRAVGWLHVRALRTLHVEPAGDICGMVVDEHHRSQGIGAALVKAAENWAAERGCHKMRVRSNAVRRDAHRFYERVGFTMTKTSLTFEKQW
jgi:GNAT superfamily N-acetyltransferase